MSNENETSETDSIGISTNEAQNPRDQTIACLKRVILRSAISREVENPQNGIVASAIEDVLNRAMPIWEVSDRGSLSPRSHGEILFGPDGIDPITLPEWIATLRATCPHLFVQDRTAKGIGADQLSRLTPLAKLRLANEGGVTA